MHNNNNHNNSIAIDTYNTIVLYVLMTIHCIVEIIQLYDYPQIHMWINASHVYFTIYLKFFKF